ncbi:right-handed parallel beta-helix repeat-containing protein [Candidatus Poribacteria bacterium]
MNGLKSVLLGFFVLVFIGSAQGIIINVPTVTYLTIQAGIDAASNGDTVLVADGIYTGAGNVNLDFHGKAITVKSENGATSCIIDCENVDGTRGFYFGSGEGLDSILDGFTIRNGRLADEPSAQYGGGIFCDISSSPTITNNIITGNAASSGGGIFCRSSAYIVNNIITDNSAGSDGGGIACGGGSAPNIEGNIVIGNLAVWHGGGLYGYNSSLEVTNNVIAENVANEWGGGIHCNYNSQAVITNNTVTGNVAKLGGGIFCKTDSSATLTNTILWNNSPQEICLYMFGANTITISYSDVQGGGDGIIYNPDDTINWLEGNMDADPLFVDLPNGDYHLQAVSPCIDAGISDGAPADDIEDNPRDDGFPDMGAYEFTAIIIVEIDVKPGSYPNSVNLGSNGVVPVAILSSAAFDATTVDPETVQLAGSGVAIRGKGSKSLAHQEDVNGDGLVDLVVQVTTENLDPDTFQDGYAILTGQTFVGQAIQGSDEISIVPPDAAPAMSPDDTRLLVAYPNPTNPDVWIPYQLGSDGKVVIRIYDMSGRLVRKIDLGHKPAGFYTDRTKAAYWDGRNEAGEQAASGVYFYNIQAGSYTATGKMIVAR